MLLIALLLSFNSPTASAAPGGFGPEFCKDRPYEAQFTARVVTTESPRFVDKKLGKLCRFKIVFESFEPSIACPFVSKSEVAASFIEIWDEKRGCPEAKNSENAADPGYLFSGVIQRMPDGTLQWDAGWDADSKHLPTDN